MRRHGQLVVLVAGVWSFAGCGGDDDGATCGDGTELVDGVCVADGDGVSCGAGTSEVDGVCVADAVGCGPGTMLEGDACVIDPDSPGPVRDLVAIVGDDGIELSWTAGSGSAGTLVARLIAGAHDQPLPATRYEVGDTLPGGAVVIAAGSATTVVDDVGPPGRYAYLAWSMRASGKLGFGREVAARSEVPLQSAVVSVDVADESGEVTSTPSDFELAVDNVAFDDGLGQLTFDLTATNGTGGQFFNPKAIVRALSLGAVAGASGTIDDDAFVSLAIGGLLPGETATATVTVGGVAGTDTVELDLEIVESDLAIQANNAIDMAGGAPVDFTVPELVGATQRLSIFTDGRFGPSGRYFYGVTRWSAGLFRLDTGTGDITGVTPITVASANGGCVTMSDDGDLIATFGLGIHRKFGANGVGVIKVDPSTMTAIGTATLFMDDEAQSVACALRGTDLALAFGSRVYMFDVGAMEFVDLDDETEEVDFVEVASEDNVRTLLYDNDGSRLFAASRRNDVNIYAIDVASREVSIYHSALDRIYGLRIDGAGTLWWGGLGGLYSFDGALQAAVPGLTSEVRAIADLTATHARVIADGELATVDLADGAVTATSVGMDNTRLGHHLQVFATQ